MGELGSTTQTLIIVTSIVSQLFWPAILVAFLFVFIKIYRTGSFGKLDLNSAFQRKYDIKAGTGAIVSLGTDLPLNSEGKVDQREFAKRTLVLVQQYHAQGLQQSSISFWFSIISAALGFAVIVYGSLLILSPGQESIGVAPEIARVPALSGEVSRLSQPILVMLSGVIIDTVAALFFVQSNKSRLLMSDFFDRLRKDRKLDEALTLIENIKSDEIAARTQALLAINLAEISLDGSVYDRVISGKVDSRLFHGRQKRNGEMQAPSGAAQQGQVVGK